MFFELNNRLGFMTIKEMEAGYNKPLKNVTLLLIRKDDEVLLAMKKRGHGAGKWNGTGGKALVTVFASFSFRVKMGPPVLFISTHFIS